MINNINYYKNNNIYNTKDNILILILLIVVKIIIFFYIKNLNSYKNKYYNTNTNIFDMNMLNYKKNNNI